MENKKEQMFDDTTSIENNENNYKIEEYIQDIIFHSEKEYKRDKINGLVKTLTKLTTVLILTLLVSNIVSQIVSKKIVERDLVGLWGDEHGNYYEIYENSFKMNVGDPKLTFFEGKIKSITITDTGYRLFIKGKKYSINNNIRTFEKNMKIVFEISNYTKELKEVMTADMGTGEYRIIRLENKINN